MRAIAEHPGIEQVDLTEAAVSTKALTLAEMLPDGKSWLVKRETIRWINVGVSSISPFRPTLPPPRYHWGPRAAFMSFGATELLKNANSSYATGTQDDDVSGFAPLRYCFCHQQ